MILKSGSHTAAKVNNFGILNPEILHISNGIRTSYGAHQIWYSSWIQRMSGCGPTAASNLLWYLASTRAECRSLFDGDATDRTEMIRLMENVWKYVTPGMRGVDKATILIQGAVRYGSDHDVRLGARVLEIPGKVSQRPDKGEVFAFLSSAFSDNLPVAFLNLSNGAVRNLDNWHWVTLVAVDQSLRARMYDQGIRQLIDLDCWLETTKGGGAFVTIEPI